MWICSKCGARVEPSFDVCWRCGTTYQGEEDPDFVVADEAEPISEPTDYLRLDVGKSAEGELPEAPFELVACFESNSLAEAQLVADELTAQGIPTVLQNTLGAGEMVPSVYVQYPCRVVVRDRDLARAREFVEDYGERKRARAARAR